MGIWNVRVKKRRTSSITRLSHLALPEAHSPTSSTCSRPVAESRADAVRRSSGNRSEVVEQRSIELARISDVREAEILQVFLRDAAHVFRRYAPEPFHE